MINKSSLFVGGEGEIRTLEPFYRLHDFQSCALDQLGDFSRRYFVLVLSFECSIILSHINENVNTFFKIFLIFLKKFFVLQNEFKRIQNMDSYDSICIVVYLWRADLVKKLWVLIKGNSVILTVCKKSVDIFMKIYYHKIKDFLRGFL